MIIKPTIRMNVAFNAHPLGCKQYVEEQIAYAKTQKPFAGPKKVLILGGSTGYGLSSRIALAVGSNADTINVSYEAGPGGSRTGTAGWWNNVYFEEYAKSAGLIAKDFIGDAFSDAARDAVINYIKNEFGGKIDLLVYSVASGKRQDPKTGETYTSSLKVIGEPLTGETIDIGTGNVIERTLEPAEQSDIDNTVKVMGGADWKLWVEALNEAGVLANGFKTVTYSYIGPKATERIYRSGTIGKAKEDMEQTAHGLNSYLENSVHGMAASVVCKAVVTRASSVIPIFPMYGAALMKVMKAHNIEEKTDAQIYRFMQEMLYGDKPEIDEAGRYRPDAWEMRPEIQAEVDAILEQVTADNYRQLMDIDGFIADFMHQNGFGYDNIDYEADLDLETLNADNQLEKL
ncbi:enoyl-ACP reductase FabV [Culicoidibacter larvae]|uniref:Trans-2-enoyl-CoA reductase [NADH] n=1 Tax=Culicoidibacter larvae TaxID=2579976 RepID=A0A5R8QGA1_9FIRM|nr:enoyl-ACP reductase FabV [Culicoidibacter larvae]TLG77069.1 trans-2-enoyl-CoA reductase family protein [Culicoidibacter larvae]